MTDWDIDDLADIVGVGNISRMPTDPSHDADYLDYISEYVDTLSAMLRPVNQKIHDNPELNYKEHIAHDTLVGFLKAQPEWDVTPSAYGISTAFVASYDTGKKGPVVSFNAEYDALVGIGHACGHNLITTASLAAALATKQVMAKYGLPGKVILFGTPAEEGGGGKIALLKAGAFKDAKVDVSIMSHPGNVHDAAVVSTSAYQGFKVEYFGKEAHAAAAPWEGINALDALITAYNGLSVLRQQTKAGDIIQGHITNGGAAPNIIHAYAAGTFVVRANTKARLAELLSKVQACFHAGAQATGATLKLTLGTSYDDHTPNHALARSYRHFFNRLGGDIPPAEIDVVNGRSNASTDQGNVSYAYPSLHSGFQIISEMGNHNPGFAEAAGTDDAHERALNVGKALAATAVEVITRKGYLKEIKDEFAKLQG